MSSSPCFAENYEEFFCEWIAQQEKTLRDLQSALKNGMDEEALETQVLRVLNHYENYYQMKAEAAKANALAMFSPTWTSPLENAFLWLGGWRPSMIFQMAYAEVGQQLELELAGLLKGINSSTLAALSSRQLYQINELQCKTLEEEEGLSQRMAVLQQTMVDRPLLSLAQAVLGGSHDGNSYGISLESALVGKVKGLENLLVDADRLRFNTIKRMLETLTPRQAVQLLITAAQLHLCLHRKGQGKKK